MRKLLIIFGCGLFLNSCSTTNYTYRSTTIQDKPVVANDVVVDVKVDLTKKIESTSSKRNTVDLAKSEAYYNAITKNNIDMVVDPIFEINTSDKFLFFGGKTFVKLTGFGGYYTNPRSKVDAIKELKLVDTLDIHKFNNIYLGIPFPKKQQSIKIKSLGVVGNSSNSDGFSQSVNANRNSETEKPKKSNLGFKVANSTTTFTSDEFGDFETAGVSLGITYDSNPNEKLGLITELLYTIDEDVDQLNIPILAKYSLTRNIKIFAGPSLTYFFDSDYKPVGFGFDYGVSLDLGKKLFFDFRFSKGLNDIGEYTELKANTSSLGVGFRF